VAGRSTQPLDVNINVDTFPKIVVMSILLCGCAAMPQDIAKRERDKVGRAVPSGVDAKTAIANLTELGYTCRTAVADAPRGYASLTTCSKVAEGGYPKCFVTVRVELLPEHGSVSNMQFVSYDKCE